MKLNTQDYNNVTVLQLQGDLNGEFSGLLKNTITETVSKQRLGIVLDMSETGFIDSNGLEQLLWAKDYCSDNNCQLRLAGLDENCTKILEVTRLSNEFDRHAELAEAVKSFV